MGGNQRTQRKLTWTQEEHVKLHTDIIPSSGSKWGPPKIIMWIGNTKLLLSVNVCVHGAMGWTGVPSRVYPHLMSSVPDIDSRSTKP